MAKENQNARRILGEYATLIVEGCATSIARPSIQANNFELKLALLQLVQQDQLGGGPLDNPNLYIANFFQLCDTFKVNRASSDTIRLRIFPFFTKRQDKSLAQISTSKEHFSTWDDLVSIIFMKFFPPQSLQSSGTILKLSLRKMGNHFMKHGAI